MKTESITLRHVVHTYEVNKEFEGHDYKIAVLVKREKGRTTYRQILVECSKRSWFGAKIPEGLRKIVNKDVRILHLKSK
jgi:hypothetical protein